MPDLDVRKQDILKATIRSYVDTAVPVGSETLAQQRRLGVSSATIRSEMASLEEMGYLTQPHTSAGRIPTDRAYRVYVDSLLDADELSPVERSRVRRRMMRVLEDLQVLPEAVARTLASVTDYASLVAQSHPESLQFRHLHFIPLSSTRVLAVIVTNAGVLRGQTLDLQAPYDPDGLDRLSRLVSRRLAGLSLGEITDEVLARAVDEAAWQQRIAHELVQWLRRQSPAGAGGRVHIEGTANILKQPEFRDARAAQPVISALEREDVIAGLLAGAPEREVWITIGGEHRIEDLRGCSVVAAAYRVGGQPVGALGIVGPTRMQYARVIALVRYLSSSLSEFLATAT